jgi:hypothetical protein
MGGNSRSKILMTIGGDFWGFWKIYIGRIIYWSGRKSANQHIIRNMNGNIVQCSRSHLP